MATMISKSSNVFANSPTRWTVKFLRCSTRNEKRQPWGQKSDFEDPAPRRQKTNLLGNIQRSLDTKRSTQDTSEGRLLKNDRFQQILKGIPSLKTDKKACSHLHSHPTFRKGSREFGCSLQTNRPQSWRGDFHWRTKNCSEGRKKSAISEGARCSHELDWYRPQWNNKLHIISGFLHGSGETILGGAYKGCIQDDRQR